MVAVIDYLARGLQFALQCSCGLFNSVALFCMTVVHQCSFLIHFTCLMIVNTLFQADPNLEHADALA